MMRMVKDNLIKNLCQIQLQFLIDEIPPPKYIVDYYESANVCKCTSKCTVCNRLILSRDEKSRLYFNASNGWFYRFIHRRKLSNCIMTGDKEAMMKMLLKRSRFNVSIYGKTFRTPQLVIKIILKFDNGAIQYKAVPK